MNVPKYLVIAVVAGWLNRQQQAAIDYLRAENEILKSQLQGRRLRLTDGERRRLATKGKALGRKLLAEIACIGTPETILAWHRRLVALKVDLSAASSWLTEEIGWGVPASANVDWIDLQIPEVVERRADGWRQRIEEKGAPHETAGGLRRDLERSGRHFVWPKHTIFVPGEQ